MSDECTGLLRRGQSGCKSPAATGSAAFSRKCEKAIVAGQGAWGVRRRWKGQVVRDLLIRVDGSGFILRVRGSHGSFSTGGSAHVVLDSALWWLCEEWHLQSSWQHQGLSPAWF